MGFCPVGFFPSGVLSWILSPIPVTPVTIDLLYYYIDTKTSAYVMKQTGDKEPTPASPAPNNVGISLVFDLIREWVELT